MGPFVRTVILDVMCSGNPSKLDWAGFQACLDTEFTDKVSTLSVTVDAICLTEYLSDPVDVGAIHARLDYALPFGFQVRAVRAT